MKYTVEVREVHVSSMEVEADSPEDAREKFKDGEGEEILCEYSHTLDGYTVKDEKGNILLS